MYRLQVRYAGADAQDRLIRAGFACTTPPDGSRRLALGHFKAPLQVPAQRAPAPRKPSGAGGGEEASRESSVSVGQCIALLKAEVERKSSSHVDRAQTRGRGPF